MARPLRLTHLSLANYRSIRELELDLGPLTVFIGPNGSGKSNVLSAIRFIARTAERDLMAALSEFGGFDSVHREAASTTARDAVRVGLRGLVTAYASSSAEDDYALSFARRSRGGTVSRDETFRFKRTRSRGRRRVIRVTGSEVAVGDERAQEQKLTTALRLASSQATGLFSAQTIQISDEGDTRGIAEFAAFLRSLVVFDPQVRQITRPARLDGQTDGGASERLSASGENLAVVLRQLHERAPDSFDRLLSAMRDCLPGLQDIVFDIRGGAAAYTVVQLREQGARRPFDLADASFGTVRMLALLAALHQLNPPPVMAIEEIDSGLHPYALDVLVERLRAATDRTQLLISSHSPTFVNRLAPEEIVVCDRDAKTGESLIPSASSAEISAAVKAADGLGAGELWFAGVLGGVPRSA